MVSWCSFGGHLGVSWAPLATFGEHLCRSFGNLGGLLWPLRPKYAPKTVPELPRGPQETPRDTPEVPRRSPKSSKKQPKEPQMPPQTMFHQHTNILSTMEYLYVYMYILKTTITSKQLQHIHNILGTFEYLYIHIYVHIYVYTCIYIYIYTYILKTCFNLYRYKQHPHLPF